MVSNWLQDELLLRTPLCTHARSTLCYVLQRACLSIVLCVARVAQRYQWLLSLVARIPVISSDSIEGMI